METILANRAKSNRLQAKLKSFLGSNSHQDDHHCSHTPWFDFVVAVVTGVTVDQLSDKRCNFQTKFETFRQNLKL
jgi:hypothetical protein